MKKILYVATVVKTHIMEFHIPYLKMLKEEGYETAVAAKNDYEHPEDCVIPYCDSYFNVPFERSPLKPSNLKAYKLLKKIIDEGEYEIIHCHTPVGAMLTRLAGKDARKKGSKIIYTAHGFHFFKGAPLINWILYYPAEKWLARYTDILITINKEDFSIAQNFKAKRIEYVPGVGIDLNKFSVKEGTREEKRKELNLKEKDIVLLSVGELIKRKNYETMLRGLSTLKNEFIYKDIKYLICGDGELRNYLENLTQELGISKNVNFLGYRNDISAICNCSDIFLFMSYQEGLPVAVMEAMACGLPCICSDIRGCSDLIDNGKSGYLVSLNEKDFTNKLLDLLNSKESRKSIGLEATKKISYFDTFSVVAMIKRIYQS